MRATINTDPPKTSSTAITRHWLPPRIAHAAHHPCTARPGPRVRASYHRHSRRDRTLAELRHAGHAVRARRQALSTAFRRHPFPAHSARLLERPPAKSACTGLEHRGNLRVLESGGTAARPVRFFRSQRCGRVRARSRRAGVERHPAARPLCLRRVGSRRLPGLVVRQGQHPRPQPRPALSRRQPGVSGRTGQPGAAAAQPQWWADHRRAGGERIRLLRRRPRVHGRQPRHVRQGRLRQGLAVHLRWRRHARQRHLARHPGGGELRTRRGQERIRQTDQVPPRSTAHGRRILGRVVRPLGQAARRHRCQATGRGVRVDPAPGSLGQSLHVYRRHQFRLHEWRQFPEQSQ